MNKVLLTGRLGRDPEVKYTKSDKAVSSFSLASDEYYGGESHTEWHRVVCWEKTAEFVGKYLKKGSLVEVEGRLQTREWEDNNGNKRQTTEIVASVVKSLVKDQPSESPEDKKKDDFEDDDIPF